MNQQTSFHVLKAEGDTKRKFPSLTHRNIYVRTECVRKLVMNSVENFLRRKLKLMINQQKNTVAKSNERKFLGFSFTPSSHELKIKLLKEKSLTFTMNLQRM